MPCDLKYVFKVIIITIISVIIVINDNDNNNNYILHCKTNKVSDTLEIISK